MKGHILLFTKVAFGLAIMAGGYLAVTQLQVPPSRALGGVIWLKNGIHYLSDEQVDIRIKEMNAPAETKMAEHIQKVTPSCDEVQDGFCQSGLGVYSVKTLITPEVEYKPGTPDRKEIIGYCTLCNDGTFSPSCAVGRGACSWHGGVASYDVAEYRIIPGTPPVEAKAATYSYVSRSYRESPVYNQPSIPELSEVAGYTR